MGTLTRFFFRAPYSAPRSGEIWRWWESRRLAYNAAVLAAGATTVGAVFLMELLTPGRPRFPSLPMLFRYGFVFAVLLTLLPIPVTALRIFLGVIL